MLFLNNVATGNAFAKTIQSLGIEDAIKHKVVRVGPEEVATRIAQGTSNDLGVGPTPMIVANNRVS